VKDDPSLGELLDLAGKSEEYFKKALRDPFVQKSPILGNVESEIDSRPLDGFNRGDISIPIRINTESNNDLMIFNSFHRTVESQFSICSQSNRYCSQFKKR
jgi:hypothetical protein